MLTCPRCHVPLRPVAYRTGPRTFACPSCAGRATTLEALRPYAPPGRLSDLWTAAQSAGAGDGQACPSCGNAMRAVEVHGHDGRLDLDACPRCRLVWFDPSEMGRLVTPRDVEADRRAADAEAKERERSLPMEARVLLAQAQAEHAQKMANPDLEGHVADQPEDPWQWIPATLGLPFEVDRPPLQALPLATWITSGMIFVLALAALGDARGTVQALGLIPAEPWRLGGLTWLTSLVVHGGLWHLLSNLYFLMLAGDDVEQVLGPARWVALFLLAGLAGSLAHVLLDPRPEVPLVGASGAISGLMAFYALRFPTAKLTIAFRMYWRFAFLKIPVWAAAIVWFLAQILGALAQRGGCTRVSAFGHLGGFAVGVAFWAWTRFGRRPAPERG